MNTAEPTFDLPLEREHLRVALAMMDEDARGFETTRAEAPAFYSERSHALTLAMHVQSLYSQIEDLFIQLLEKRGLMIRRTGDWRPLLLQAAAADGPSGRPALLCPNTYEGLASMLKLHQAISRGAGAVRPARLIAALPAVRATIARCIDELSRPCDDRTR